MVLPKILFQMEHKHYAYIYRPIFYYEGMLVIAIEILHILGDFEIVRIL